MAEAQCVSAGFTYLHFLGYAVLTSIAAVITVVAISAIKMVITEGI